MADVAISAQTDGSDIAADDEVPVNRGGLARRAKVMRSPTFTPGISFGGGTTGLGYSTPPVGQARRIGNIVYVSGYITLSNKGSSTGAAKITGLPYTVNSSFYGCCTLRPNLALGYALVGRFDPGTTTIAVDNAETGAGQTDANFSNTSSLIFTGWYWAA